MAAKRRKKRRKKIPKGKLFYNTSCVLKKRRKKLEALRIRKLEAPKD